MAWATASPAEEERIIELSEESAQRGLVDARPIGGTSAKSAPQPSVVMENIPLTVTLPSGAPYRGYLITAQDPESGLFWWTFQGAGRMDPADRIADPPKRLTFFVSEREIVGVELLDLPPSLGFLRSGSRVATVDEARAAAAGQVARSARAIEEGTAQWFQAVGLTGVLPQDFYFDPYHSMPRLEVEVTAMERQGSGWIVELRGRGGRTAELQLSDRFLLRSAQETTPEATP